MALVHTFTLPHYEQYPVHVAVFNNVTNAAFLRGQLLAANPDFDYAFLDAKMILTPSHLLTASFLSLHAFLTTHIHKTRTPHSELVFRLSPTNNIGESYKTFGISDDSSHIIAVKLPITADGTLDESVTRESVAAHLGSVVEGSGVNIEDGNGELELGQGCDLQRVRKAYKLGDGGKRGKKGDIVNGEKKNEQRDMESVILGIIALKGT